MGKEELINKICHALLDRYFYIDFDPIKNMLELLESSTLGDILSDLERGKEEHEELWKNLKIN